jgi:hypothetical protein
MKFGRDHVIPFAAEGATRQVGAENQTLRCTIRAIILPYMGRDLRTAGNQQAEH